jgi:hypothetical protein
MARHQVNNAIDMFSLFFELRGAIGLVLGLVITILTFGCYTRLTLGLIEFLRPH